MLTEAQRKWLEEARFRQEATRERIRKIAFARSQKIRALENLVQAHLVRAPGC